MPQVFLKPKSPEDSEKYNMYEVNNMKVYINKELILADEIRIRYPEYASDLSDKEFEVEGATAPPM